MTENGEEYPDDDLTDDQREELEAEEEDRAMEADPYDDDEKDQMGSSEFFNDND